MKLNFFITFIILILITVLPLQSHANFKLSPVTFYLKRDSKIVKLEVTNTTNETKFVQADVLKWNRIDSTDEYIGTEDLIITPAIFELKPQKKQVLRIAKNIENFGPNEAAYRISLREIVSKNNAPKKNSISFSFNFMLPLLIEPIDKLPFEEGFIINRDKNKISFKNNLNYHVKVNGISSANDKTKMEPLLFHVFPDEQYDLYYPSKDSDEILLRIQYCDEEHKIKIS